MAPKTHQDIRKSLPEAILEEILSWAPAKTVLRWKVLSKPWLGRLENPIFARNHFSRAPFYPLVVFSYESIHNSSRRMHLLEGQTVSDLDDRPRIFNKFKPMSRIDFYTRKSSFQPNKNAISCEGLVCWAACDGHLGDYVIICNPVTNEYVSISAPTMEGDKRNVFIGIGFCQATKKFELLRMSSSRKLEESSLSWPEVLTVGDTQWRRVGDATSEWNFFGIMSEVVYVKGAIYWSYKWDSTTFSFHFESAKFQVIPLPKMEDDDLMLETSSFTRLTLGVLANSLCVLLLSLKDGHVELWNVENDGVSQVQWNKLFDHEIKKTHLKHSGKWSRGEYKAIKYLCGGEILMHVRRGKFIVYDPITKEVTDICLFENSKCVEGWMLDRLEHVQVVTHVPRVMKLKEALNMDEDSGVKVMKGWGK